MRVQNAVLAVLTGASFLVLTLVAVSSRHGSRRDRWAQATMGGIIGLGAATVILSIRTDLVPDELELAIAAGMVVIAAVTLTLAVLRRSD